MCRCVQVCAGVRRCVQVCAGVCRRVRKGSRVAWRGVARRGVAWIATNHGSTTQGDAVYPPPHEPTSYSQFIGDGILAFCQTSRKAFVLTWKASAQQRT